LLSLCMSGSRMATGVPGSASMIDTEDVGRVEGRSYTLNTVDSVVCVMITSTRGNNTSRDDNT
jgi:hypothetical protein